MIASPLTVVPLSVAVVVLVAVCLIVSEGVVRSFAKHAQPFGAVAEPPIVIVTVHVPVVPDVNEPAVAPPTRAVSEQPALDVNFVPSTSVPGTTTGFAKVAICVEAEMVMSVVALFAPNPRFDALVVNKVQLAVAE